jgi:hypothetical protein
MSFVKNSRTTPSHEKMQAKAAMSTCQWGVCQAQETSLPQLLRMLALGMSISSTKATKEPRIDVTRRVLKPGHWLKTERSS